MIAATPRARACVVALGLVTACTEPTPPEDARAQPVAPAPAEPEPEPACRDWSTVDLDELPPLTEGAQAPLLDQVWRRVAQKHYDPTLGCLRWGAMREVYARKVAEARSDAEAYAHINALLDELGQSHLRLFPPVRDDEAMGPASPALTVRWIEDGLVVVRSEAVGPQGPVLPGASLLAIDDQPITTLVERVRGRTEPHAFPLEIARAVAARLSCARAGQVHKLEVTHPAKDHHRAIRVVPCLAPQGERVTLGNLRDIPTRVEHRMLEAKVGLLAFNVWMLPMVKEVSRALDELRASDMRALVIDLRGNPGGVGAMVVPVARLLLDPRAHGAAGDAQAWPSTISLGTLRFRDFEQQLVVEPAASGAFTGPVAVLVDESTASTSEIFVMGLRELGRVVVVGARPSAGAALPSVIEQLHGGALLQYVVADYRSPRGTVVEGRGIVPDVVVPETRDDFAAGRDPVLDAARLHLVGMLDQAPHVAPHVEGVEGVEGVAEVAEVAEGGQNGPDPAPRPEPGPDPR